MFMRHRILLLVALPLAGSLAACDQLAVKPPSEAPPPTEAPGGEPPPATAVVGTDAVTSTAAAGDSATGGREETGDAGAGGTEPAADAGELVATVNGEPILMVDFQRQAFDTQRYFVEQGIDPNTEAGQKELLFLRRQVLSDMINQRLVEQAARELKVTVSDDEVEASLNRYVTELGGEEKFTQSLKDTGATREQVRDMERASLIAKKMLDQIAADVPATAEFVHARHILCKDARACQDALVRVDGGEDFAAVAKGVSQDQTTKDNGGDLDWVTRGMLPSQKLEGALFKLQSGQRSEVVETEFGFHVIEVLERDPSRELEEAQRNQLRQNKLLAWQAERRKASKIEIFVEDLKEPTE